jgi:AraC-like DNA-binding protein
MISRERYVGLETIPVRYLSEMLARAGMMGERARAILLQADLPEEILEVPQFRCSVLQYARLYHVLRRSLDDEVFGFFRRPVPVGAYATLLSLLSRCSDTKDAFDAATAFYRVFDPHPYWTLQRNPASVTLSTSDEGQASSIFFVHTMLLSLWRTLLWLTDQRAGLRGMKLDRGFATLTGETRFLFGVEPELSDGENAIFFDAHLLDLPVARRPSDAVEHATSSLIEMLGPAEVETLESRIRGFLSADRPIACSTLADVASHLGLSRQTLSRRLQDRGTSFQAVKDDLRRDHAIAMLTGSDRSIAEIAELLGYSEPSAFARAFRAWTGVSPGRYRGSVHE